MVKFEYLKPRSLDEAISLMESYGEESVYVAGATDVMVKIREHKISPKYLISLRHIDGLDDIRPFRFAPNLSAPLQVKYRRS